MEKILWSKNHKYIMIINSSLDGYFYIQVFMVGKSPVTLKIYGSLAHNHEWAFNQAKDEIIKRKVWQEKNIKL